MRKPAFFIFVILTFSAWVSPASNITHDNMDTIKNKRFYSGLKKIIFTNLNSDSIANIKTQYDELGLQIPEFDQLYICILDGEGLDPDAFNEKFWNLKNLCFSLCEGFIAAND